MNRYIPPSDFYTFDPLMIDPALLVDPILSSMAGDHEEIKMISPKVEGIQELVNGEPAIFDRATLLFLAALDWDLYNDSSRPLDGGKGSKEKLGRWPTEDGNAIAYLIENIRSPTKVIEELLAKLALGFMPDFLGEDDFDKGAFGLNLMGWITHSEVKELRREINRGRWTVNSNESFDGGVQDGFRHLSNLLQGAAKHGVGLMMRRHC